MLSDALLSQIGITQEEFLRFVLMFARFEYALKRTEGFACDRNGKIEVNWTELGKELTPLFEINRSKELSDAVMYFQREPALKQTLKDGVLDFKETKRRTKESPLVQLLDNIRVARNNLFHGGKFPQGQVHDPARNSELLNNACRILEECLELCRSSGNERLQQVYSAFCQRLD